MKVSWDDSSQYMEKMFQTTNQTTYYIAMENGPFIDDFPIKTVIYKGFSMAMLDNQRVNIVESV